MRGKTFFPFVGQTTTTKNPLIEERSVWGEKIAFVENLVHNDAFLLLLVLSPHLLPMVGRNCSFLFSFFFFNAEHSILRGRAKENLNKWHLECGIKSI